MDAIELLVGQHRLLESTLDELLDTDDDTERARLLGLIGDHLAVHISAEEQVFYPAVRALRNEDKLLESLEEHLSLKRLLTDLNDLAADDPTFQAKCKVLQEQTEHHHKEEEEDLFPGVRERVDAAERDRLGHEMLALQGQMKRDGVPREVMAEQTDKAAPLK